MSQFTFAPDPEAHMRSLQAARALRAIGFPASGAFLSAAEHLIDQGIQVSQESLANALHEHP